MPTSRSVAERTTPPGVASSFTFVSTGLGERVGTTAVALCSAARSGSFGQRIFIDDLDPFPVLTVNPEAPYCTRKRAC